MKVFLSAAFLLTIVFNCPKAFAGAIIFNEKNATVWLPMQSIAGSVRGEEGDDLKLYCNNTTYEVKINADKTFKCRVKLKDGKNMIWASCGQPDAPVTSGSLVLTLGYHPLPYVKPFAVVENEKIKLTARLIDNPNKQTLKFEWIAAKGNPAVCSITDKRSKTTGVNIPAQKGRYYFTLLVIAGNDTARFKTYVIRNASGLHAYQLDSDHAAWIDSAVIYEINPSIFVKQDAYDAITKKLGEIKSMGINTIWLQPVYQTDDSGQGYSVTDYFKLRDDYGTEQQLATLINTAKKLHLRVMFDFVPNHTSISHPYAQDCIKYADSSHYDHFYQRSNDGTAYSSFYHKDANGFYYYFWDQLVNLDYNNAEVQQWMLEATTYWLKKYDIDGYRFDAMWGLNARSPQFIKMLSTRLKSIKPDLLLLAEDKPSDKMIYSNGFDAAYDWTADSSWVSQWAWQTHHSATKSITIFNSHDSLKRSALLAKAIFKNASANHTSLRFMENNDVPRFIATHSLAQTKMAAALLFSLPGIPMLYNGQETGCTSYPYSNKVLFSAERSIAGSDNLGLMPYYTKLIKLRAQFPALYGKTIKQIPLNKDPFMVAYERSSGRQHFIIIINLNSLTASANLQFDEHQNAALKLEGDTKFTDVLTGVSFKGSKNGLQVPMNGYDTRWLLINDKNSD